MARPGTQASDSDANSAGFHLQTVSRALAALDVLAHHPEGMTAKAIAAALEVSLGSAYHLIRTLIAAGHASQDPVGRLFRLGPRISQLNATYVAGIRAAPWRLPFAQALQQATGETAGLYAWWGAYVVASAVVEGSRPDRLPGEYIGCLSRPHVTAAGKVLLAWSTEERVNAALSTLDQAAGSRSNGLSSDALRAELAHIRQDGYALDRGVRHPDACCVAAPMRDAEGSVDTALVVVVPRRRFPRDEALLIDTVLGIAQAARSGAQSADRALMPGDPEYPTVVDAAILETDLAPRPSPKM
jgi:IclR family acetate operon transcriptional repressor